MFVFTQIQFSIQSYSSTLQLTILYSWHDSLQKAMISATLPVHSYTIQKTLSFISKGPADLSTLILTAELTFPEMPWTIAPLIRERIPCEMTRFFSVPFSKIGHCVPQNSGGSDVLNWSSIFPHIFHNIFFTRRSSELTQYTSMDHDLFC